MLNNLSEQANAQMTLSRASFATCAIASTDSKSASLNSPERSRVLPYQADHQAELLDLQAETEALLSRLQSLKQQRLASVQPSGNSAVCERH
jgi:hypothetical protein